MRKNSIEDPSTAHEKMLLLSRFDTKYRRQEGIMVIVTEWFRHGHSLPQDYDGVLKYDPFGEKFYVEYEAKGEQRFDTVWANGQGMVDGQRYLSRVLTWKLPYKEDEPHH